MAGHIYVAYIFQVTAMYYMVYTSDCYSFVFVDAGITSLTARFCPARSAFVYIDTDRQPMTRHSDTSCQLRYNHNPNTDNSIKSAPNNDNTVKSVIIRLP